MYSNDQAAVYNATLLVAPRLYGGYRRQQIRCEPRGAGVWNVEVQYGWTAQTLDDVDPPEDLDPLGPEYSFDINAENLHITQSLETISKTGRGSITPPDYNRAIGVTRDRVEGTDIRYPHLEFSVTGKVKRVTLPYIRTLRSMTAKTNSRAWRGFPRGELLFLGATGQSQPGEPWSITFKFAANETWTNYELVPPTTKITRTATATRNSNTLSVVTPNTTGITANMTITGPGIPSGTTVGIVGANSITMSDLATDDATSTYTFSTADGLTIPEKRAWDYLWVSYEDTVNANLLVQIPRAAYVERVYKEVDFSLLGIGG